MGEHLPEGNLAQPSPPGSNDIMRSAQKAQSLELRTASEMLQTLPSVAVTGAIQRWLCLPNSPMLTTEKPTCGRPVGLANVPLPLGWSGCDNSDLCQWNSDLSDESQSWEPMLTM